MSLRICSNFLRVTTFLILDVAEVLLDARDMSDIILAEVLLDARDTSDIILRTGNAIIYQLQTAVIFMTVPKVTSSFCIPLKTFDSTLRFCKFNFILLRCVFKQLDLR